MVDRVPRPEPSLVTAGDGLRFAAEMATYVCVGVACWRVHPLAAVAAVAAMAAWWGLLHSPKARWHLPRPLDLVVRTVWFTIGLLAALWMLVG